MSYLVDGYYTETVATAPVDARVAFIRRTYAHLFGAIMAFVGLTALLLNLPGIDGLMLQLFSTGKIAWLFVIGGFILVSYVADRWARSETSETMQYMGLGLYVVAEAVIFLPLLWIATNSPKFMGEHVIEKAALLTALVFGGITATVFITKKDFSFMRMALMAGSFLAFGVVLASLFFNIGGLGVVFMAFMVALASGYILYHTSNIMHHYGTHQHVAASLALFASVALLFYYILQLVMSYSNSSD